MFQSPQETMQPFVAEIVVDGGGEVNTGALGLSVNCVCVGALELGSVEGVGFPLSGASDVPVVGG